MAKAEVEKKTDDGLAAVVRKMQSTLDKVVHYIESQTGYDINGDGKAGSARLGLLLILCVVASLCFGAEVIRQNQSGTAMVTYGQDSDGIPNGDMTLAGTLTAAGTAVTSGTTGAVPTVVSTTATATETTFMPYKTVIVCNDVPITNLTVGTTNIAGSVKLYDFDEGILNIKMVVVEGVIITPTDVSTNTGFAASDGGDWALGSAAASTNLATATEIDFCPKTSQDPLNGTNSAYLAAGAIFDGTSTAKDLYFNLNVDGADITSGVGLCTFDATITIYHDPVVDY